MDFITISELFTRLKCTDVDYAYQSFMFFKRTVRQCLNGEESNKLLRDIYESFNIDESPFIHDLVIDNLFRYITNSSNIKSDFDYFIHRKRLENIDLTYVNKILGTDVNIQDFLNKIYR